jgi:hypothetical protein
VSPQQADSTQALDVCLRFALGLKRMPKKETHQMKIHAQKEDPQDARRAIDAQSRASLNSSWLKHQWSQRHLNLLYHDLSTFYRPKDKSSRGDDNPNSIAKFARKPFEVPLHDWSLVLGDAIHNMRSALDHIAYALALKYLSARNIRKLPDRRTSFPLLGIPNSGQFDSATTNIEAAARDEIERLQPYNRRNRLWFLSELDVADKHHKLVIHSARLSATGPITVSAGQIVEFGFTDGGVITLDQATGKPTEQQLQPNLSLSITLEVQLPRTGESMPLAVIQEVHDFIGRDVIPAFARFFK